MPLGSNAVVKNKAGTAFDNVLRKMANCCSSDTNRTVCSHWVLSTRKFTHFIRSLKRSEILLKPAILGYFENLPLCDCSTVMQFLVLDDYLEGGSSCVLLVFRKGEYLFWDYVL